MKIKKAISLVMAGIDSVLSGFAMTASAQAAKQLYVATDGSDSNSGSISAPFATLEAARDAARAIDG